MLQETKNKILIVSLICILTIIGGITYYFIQKENNEEYWSFEENLENIMQNNKINEIVEETEKIVIHISGQVANPGVITLEKGARLIDAINIAGGTTKDADLSEVNLAYILEDAQKIYIPNIKDKEEEKNISSSNGNNGIITNGSTKTLAQKEEKIMVNINTSSKEELQKLPGIGESTAEKIITYRKENGKFNTIEDIQKVSGIGNSKFNKIKNSICVK